MEKEMEALMKQFAKGRYVLQSLAKYENMMRGLKGNADAIVSTAWVELSEGEYKVFTEKKREEYREALTSVVMGVFEEYKSDYKKLTEVVLCTNWKSWSHYEKVELIELSEEEREEVVRTYSSLYYKVMDMFYDIYRENEAATRYFFEVTD